METHKCNDHIEVFPPKCSICGEEYKPYKPSTTKAKSKGVLRNMPAEKPQTIKMTPTEHVLEILAAVCGFVTLEGIRLGWGDATSYPVGAFLPHPSKAGLQKMLDRLYRDGKVMRVQRRCKKFYEVKLHSETGYWLMARPLTEVTM